MTPFGDVDVGGLDVPVNDAFAVGRIKRVGDLDPRIQHLFEWKSFARDAMLQGLPFQKLHRNERFAVQLTNVVDRTDVGVVQG